jgi:hypothetical protein
LNHRGDETGVSYVHLVNVAACIVVNDNVRDGQCLQQGRAITDVSEFGPYVTLVAVHEFPSFASNGDKSNWHILFQNKPSDKAIHIGIQPAA